MYKAKIQGHSMEPTLHNGEIVYFRKSRQYKKGDIVIAKYNGHLIVKRICATAGQKISSGKIIEEGYVYLEGDNTKTTIKVIVPIKNIKASLYCKPQFIKLSDQIYRDLCKKFNIKP